MKLHIRSLRTKLMVLVSLALLVVLTYVGIGVWNSTSSLLQFRDVRMRTAVLQLMSNFLLVLEEEQSASMRRVTGIETSSNMAEVRKKVNDAIGAWASFQYPANLKRLLPPEVFTQAMNKLTELRALVDKNATREIVMTYFDELINSYLLMAPPLVDAAVGEHGRRLTSLIMLEQARVAANQLMTKLTETAGEDRPITIQKLETMLQYQSQVSSTLTSLALSVSPDGREKLKAIKDHEGWGQMHSAMRRITSYYYSGTFGVDGSKLHRSAMDFLVAFSGIMENEYEGLRHEMLIKERNSQLALIGTVIMMLFSVAIILIPGLLLVRGILGPVMTVTETLREISDGGGDLTKRIEVHGQDEIGQLAADFNSFTGTLASLVLEVKETSEKLGDLGQDLSSTISETSAAAVQIAANVNSVKNLTISQSAGATESAATTERIVEGLTTLRSSIDAQASSLGDSSSSIEQMVANIRAVTGNVERMGTEYGALVQAAGEGRSVLDRMTTEVRQIAERSERLQNANALIASIAAQTNLLAMNAAIEAAHAGDAGRGFAVVADEIRKLAENSSRQSKAIATDVREIRGAIDAVVSSSSTATNSFSGVIDKIDELNVLEEAIMAAMKEQSAGSTQILDALNLINEVTGQVTQGAAEMSEGSRMVLEEIQRLQDASVQIEQSMVEIAAGTQEVSEAANSATKVAADNKDAITILAERMGRFRT